MIVGLNFAKQDVIVGWNFNAPTVVLQLLSRHTVVCRAAQEASKPHREYINRKKT